MSVKKSAGIVTAYGSAVQGGYKGTYEEFCGLLAEIPNVINDLENMTVDVTTLAAGSSATASYADGVLTLGIPKGDQGDKGDKGDKGNKGDTGATPAFSIGTVTTGAAGTNAAASLTGTAEAPVLNLTIPKGADGAVPAAAIAGTEATTTASKAYAVGDRFFLGGTLYVATAPIASGGTITVSGSGANCKADVLGDDVSDLKESFSDTQDWLGYPKNVFDARTFTVSNTNNWSIDSATKTSITIRHNNTYSTGYPIAVLNLPAGKYDFHADYTDSNTPFSLRANGSWVKSLNDGAEIDIDEEDIYEIYFSNSVAGTYTITNIGIIPQETTGKIPTIEADISVLQTSESATAQTVEDLQTGFNSIAQPKISELVGEETLNKSINASGALITAGSDYYRVIKYRVTVGKKYWVTACANWGNVPWCIYDSNDTPILTGTPSERQSDFTIINNEEITTPVNSAYIIIAYQTTAIQGVLKTQTGFKIAKWAGKKWVCVGDSLTAENIRTTKHYFDYVAEKTGITTVNMGVSGSGYARMADSNQAFYQRISSCPTDADVVTIFGSFNDLGAGLQIGSVDDTGTDTLAGCINTTITNLQAVIPLVNLGIVAPTPWNTTQPATSGQDYNYVEMLKAICERRSIPFLDLWRCSNLRPWDADFRAIAYSKDEGSGTHPDENGHKLIAPRFEGFLETLLL